MATVAYWRAKLFRNTYRDRDGKTVLIPEWYCRMRHAGVTKKVRLTHTDKERAAEQAVALFLKLEREGWDALEARNLRGRDAVSVAEFWEIYEKVSRSMKRPPRKITLTTYRRCLFQLCALVGVKTIRQLTPAMVEKACDIYRAHARAEGRKDSAIQNSLSRLLRGAAGCFTREALAIMGRQGFEIKNPLLGKRQPQDLQPVAPLDVSVVRRIWEGLPALRDGNPHAKAPDLDAFRASYKEKHGGRKARWLPADFTKPHPHAAAAVLLAFGAGLRRNEVDKARWDWLVSDGSGNYGVQISLENDFRPKGGTSRTIRIPKELYDAIHRTRKDLSSPYIIGGQPGGREKKDKEYGYRRPEVFRAVNEWLRGLGVSSRTPLHQMRKQFGCETVTAFGLFVTQKLLGHKYHQTTVDYYANLTDQPKLGHIRITG